MSVSVELPKYQSYKKVWALKIKSIIQDDLVKQMPAEGLPAVIVPEEEGYAPFEVDAAYMNKHKPKEGGYYVVYDDGYKSWSPAEAFESGYAKIKVTRKRNNTELNNNELMPTDEEIFTIVEKILFEQASSDPMGECVNKMNLLRQFISDVCQPKKTSEPMADIKVFSDKVEVDGCMDGYGGGIRPDQITITDITNQ